MNLHETEGKPCSKSPVPVILAQLNLVLPKREQSRLHRGVEQALSIPPADIQASIFQPCYETWAYLGLLTCVTKCQEFTPTTKHQNSISSLWMFSFLTKQELPRFHCLSPWPSNTVQVSSSSSPQPCPAQPQAAQSWGLTCGWCPSPASAHPCPQGSAW